MPTMKLIRDPAEFPDSHEAIVDAEEAEAWKANGWINAPSEEPAAEDAPKGRKKAEAAGE